MASHSYWLCLFWEQWCAGTWVLSMVVTAAEVGTMAVHRSEMNEDRMLVIAGDNVCK